MKRLPLSLLAGMLAAGAAGAQTVQDTVTTFGYDSEGNVTEVKNGLNHATKYRHDALGRLTRITDPNTGVETYTTNAYDLRDQNTQVRDARNVTTDYAIDGLGNLTQTTSADTGVTTSGYDEAGNLTSRTDAKQQVTTYKYDAINRLTLITYHDGSTVTYLYDQGDNAIGQLSKITEASGTISYDYDADGRLKTDSRMIGGELHIVGYSYDSAGRLNGMRYPSGRTVDYGFDAQGRINKITSTLGGVTTPILNNVSYQPFGPVKTITFGNDRTQSRSYDLDGRVATFSLSSQTMKVGYDAGSRLTSIADLSNSNNGTIYGYDLLDRLTSVNTQTSSQTYEYDAVGNRKLKLNNGAPTTYTYGTTSNRLTHVGGVPVPMDSNGSITGKPNATFDYDVRGRMVSANTLIGQVRYTINSLGQRVRKITPTETTVFHYDTGGKLIAEATTAGGSTRIQEYVYLGDLAVAVMK